MILSLNTKNIYFIGYLSKNKITNNLKMNKPYSFSIDQMNGIVEDTYAKIINECENLKKNTNCPNEQVVALLSLIASNYVMEYQKKNKTLTGSIELVAYQRKWISKLKFRDLINKLPESNYKKTLKKFT